MSKRYKEVFDTSEIAHLWAHATQRSARNKQGNFSFGATELRSYSTVIAERRTHNGNTVFFCIDNTWSATTNKHQCEMRRAVFGDYVFDVKEFPPIYRGVAYHGKEYARNVLASIRQAHKRNVDAMMAHAEYCAIKSSRARTNAEWYAKDAARWYGMAQRYVATFHVRVTLPPLDIAAIADAAKERAALQTKREQTAQRRREALTELINGERDKHLPGFVQDWRTNGHTNHVYAYRSNFYRWYIYDARAQLGTDLMRYDAASASVVTSLGVRVEASAVRLLARTVLSAMTATTARDDLCTKLVGRHVDEYIIDAIDADTVTVGCHRFSRDEVARIAETLDRVEAVPSSPAPMDSIDPDDIGEHDSNRRA